jgi:predicted nicotinamide N-methyase
MGKKKDKSEKKTQHEAYGVTILRSAHPEIRGLKKDHEPEIHGDKLWNSSYLIMDYLQHQGMPPESHVLEVGCGWGLLGIYCAKQFGADVTGVDADPNVFPYLHAQAEANDVVIKTRKSRFESLRRGHLEDYDLMVGGDICFWDELIDPVYKLARRAVKAGVDQIIIADPGRPPFDTVCEMAVKKLGAEVIQWEVKSPTKVNGWLLIIGGLPTMRLA